MILVTGGTGLVGTHLLYTLAAAGENVRAIRRATADLSEVKAVFAYYGDVNEALFQRIEWVEGDVTDLFSLEDALEGVEYVYHCAALVSFDPRDRRLMQRINEEGTANVVNACLDAGIKKLCHVSSTAAVGKTIDKSLIDERTLWKNSPENSHYAITKYNAEREVWRGIEEGLNAVIVNPGIIIGPSSRSGGSPAMFRQVAEGLRYYTSGSTGFVDVRDVVRLMTELMKSGISGQRYLLVAQNLPFREVFDSIAVALDRNKPSVSVAPVWSGLAWRIEKLRRFFFGGAPLITRETARSAYQQFAYNNRKAQAFAPQPFIPIHESILHACNFYRQRRPTAK